MRRNLSLLLVLFCFAQAFAQKTYQCVSPDQQLKVKVEIGEKIQWSLTQNNTTLVQPSEIALTLGNGEILGSNAKGIRAKNTTKNEVIQTPLYKKKEIKNSYNELSLSFSGDYGLIFRVYDDGVAYRFVTSRKGDLIVKQEVADFNLNDISHTFVPWVLTSNTSSFESQFENSFENLYSKTALTSWDKKRLAFLPVLAVNKSGVNLCITEADLENYPNMYLNNKNGSTTLSAVFASYPKKVKQGGHNELQLVVQEREDFIAKTVGTRSFPWRTIVVSDDKGLANNDMVYRLATPSRIADVSWIKPGKVAWDWWNDWNIYGVNFEAGVNNATYKYYIDFAAANHIEYVILDEGWSVNHKADLMQVVPEINVKELCDYAKGKGVGIILWAGMYALEKDI
ncbi:MAG: glycoside hydrolase family 97 N-terminal domain-containing protein, partial [Bacteroidales bacterium]|nr:glycoside hydrolase family 97 N-terminal domain-containing protein [Bacteroidales bacterium]